MCHSGRFHCFLFHFKMIHIYIFIMFILQRVHLKCVYTCTNLFKAINLEIDQRGQEKIEHKITNMWLCCCMSFQGLLKRLSRGN